MTVNTINTNHLSISSSSVLLSNGYLSAGSSNIINTNPIYTIPNPYSTMEFGDHKFQIKLTLNNPDDWVKMAEIFSRLFTEEEIKHTMTYFEDGVEVHKSER
jgi:hypothetical protein